MTTQVQQLKQQERELSASIQALSQAVAKEEAEHEAAQTALLEARTAFELGEVKSTSRLERRAEKAAEALRQSKTTLEAKGAALSVVQERAAAAAEEARQARKREAQARRPALVERLDDLFTEAFTVCREITALEVEGARPAGLGRYVETYVIQALSGVRNKSQSAVLNELSAPTNGKK